MTIIHNTNTISTTIGELRDICKIALLHHGDDNNTLISIEIDAKGNGKVSSPHPTTSLGSNSLPLFDNNSKH